MDGSLSLILPAYNEADGIAAAVIEADDALAQFARDYEILVVDDGSRDETPAEVERLVVSRPHVRLIRHEINRGYGAALRTGFEAARGDRVAFTDADGQFDLADLERLVYLGDDVPIVVGYRVDRQDPWPRRFYSWGYNQIVRRLLRTGVRDCDCALKVYRRETLARLLPESTHFFVNTEMLTNARQQKVPIAEVGVKHRLRRAGTSKVSLMDIPRTLGVLLPFWWSRVAFSSPPVATGGSKRGDHPPVATGGLVGLLCVLAIAALLLFCRLGSPLLEPEEARYAEIPRQMLEADRWIVPVLHGQDYLDKPPLFYWLVMGSYSLFGVHDWAARIAAGLVAWLVVLTTALWARRVLGPRAGFCAAMILTLMPEFVYRGRMITPNGLLALFTTVALAAGHIARMNERLHRGLWLIAGLAIGLGLLTKGPVALALVVPPLVLVGWLDRRMARVGWWWFGFLGIAALVAAPWYVAVAIRCPEFAGYFFWFHNVVRFAAPFDHAKPFWTYLPQLALGLLPWSILLVPLIAWLCRSHAVRARPAALGLALIAALWGLAFFSLAGSKRPVYLVPLLPPLALVLGCALDHVVPRVRLSSPWNWIVQCRSAIAWRTAAIALAASIALGGAALAADINKAERVIGPIVVAGLILTWLIGRERKANWLTAGTAAFGMVALAAHDLLPGYARRFSLKRAAQSAPASAAVYCYPQPFDAVSFYRRDNVVTFGADSRPRLIDRLQNEDALLFVKTSHLRDVLADLPPTLEFVRTGEEAGVTSGRVAPRRSEPVTGYARSR